MNGAGDVDLVQTLQQLQQEVARLRQREMEMTQTIQQLAAPTSPTGSVGGGGALAELIGAQRELITALKSKEQVKLVDNKGLGKPEKFDGNAERFLSWKIKTSSYLGSVRKDLREVLVWAEENDYAITNDMVDKAYGLQADEIDRIENIEDLRKEVWDALLMLTEKEPFDIILNANECGFEGWRRLNRRYDPLTGGRKRALLNAILTPSRSKMEDLPANLEKLLDSIRVYERRKDSDGNRVELAADIKANVIERLVPPELERHLVLNRDRFKTFDSMVNEIQAYVEHTTGNKMKTANSQNPDAYGRPNDPMDVGILAKGDKGKGRQKGGDKTGKGKSGGDEKKVCFNCNKPGHVKAECWAPGGGKAKEGKGQKKGSAKSSGKGKGGGKPSKGSKPKGGKGVNNVEQDDAEPEEENWEGEEWEPSANGLTLFGLTTDEFGLPAEAEEGEESELTVDSDMSEHECFLSDIEDVD
eukprot:Skav214678  [mRNA]  locus=scaffold923:680348:681763:+ [translate_table: standard]